MSILIDPALDQKSSAPLAADYGARLSFTCRRTFADAPGSGSAGTR
ncbi:hypothetical protein [Nocardia sp. A7]